MPLQNDLCEWLRLFTNENFKVDTPRKQRAQSFISPREREKQARELSSPELVARQAKDGTRDV